MWQQTTFIKTWQTNHSEAKIWRFRIATFWQCTVFNMTLDRASVSYKCLSNRFWLYFWCSCLKKKKSVWLNMPLHDNTCIYMSYLLDINVVLFDMAKCKTIKRRILLLCLVMSGERSKPDSVTKIQHSKLNSNLQKNKHINTLISKWYDGLGALILYLLLFWDM